jgi:hypothetical protein
MPIPYADKLIERAQKGERLTAKDRRHCVGYLMGTRPEMTNVEAAEIFQVSEGLIRQDKKRIRHERAKLIKEDDIGLVIADIAMECDNQIRDLEASKRKCKMGQRAFVEHCKAIVDTRLKSVKALQELGFYPKSLGNLTVERFEYKAVVGRDGSVDTRAADIRFDGSEIIDADFEEQLQLEAPADEENEE